MRAVLWLLASSVWIIVSSRAEERTSCSSIEGPSCHLLNDLPRPTAEIVARAETPLLRVLKRLLGSKSAAADVQVYTTGYVPTNEAPEVVSGKFVLEGDFKATETGFVVELRPTGEWRSARPPGWSPIGVRAAVEGATMVLEGSVVVGGVDQTRKVCSAIRAKRTTLTVPADVARTPVAKADARQDVTGLWSGVYSCAGSRTVFSLSMASVDVARDSARVVSGSLVGVLAFEASTHRDRLRTSHGCACHEAGPCRPADATHPTGSWCPILVDTCARKLSDAATNSPWDYCMGDGLESPNVVRIDLTDVAERITDSATDVDELVQKVIAALGAEDAGENEFDEDDRMEALTDLERESKMNEDVDDDDFDDEDYFDEDDDDERDPELEAKIEAMSNEEFEAFMQTEEVEYEGYVEYDDDVDEGEL